jgi:hypothetical protein
VYQAKQCAGRRWGQRHLDRARTWRHAHFWLSEAPAEHHAARRFDLEELALHVERPTLPVVARVYLEALPAGARVERGFVG